MLSIILLTVLSVAKAENKPADVLEPSLKMLRDLKAGKTIGPFQDRIAKPKVSVSIRLLSSPTTQQLTEWEALGIQFSRRNGELVQLGKLYFALVPWQVLDQLAAQPITERIDLAQPLHVQKPLDVSLPEIQATTVNERIGGLTGSKLTGAGVTVANFDTGLDVLHPAFFRPDGGSYGWVDVDGDQLFSAGIDGVDWDEDGTISPQEILHIHHAEINSYAETFYYGTSESFEADIDWLFLDLDADGLRSAGSAAGFSDTDSGFGEPIFIVEDRNGDATLDLGERILQLGSSKVIASFDGDDAEEHTLASGNLIDTEIDDDGHGTSVSGIVLGGHSQFRRYRGVAPDADYIIADIYGTTAHSEAIAWAETQGADVMLHEISAFTGQYLDGSSNREVAVQTAHNNGISQICPAGNIGENYRHGSVNVVADGEWAAYYFSNPDELSAYGSLYFYLTVLSTVAMDNVDVVIRQPSGSQNDFLFMSHESDTNCDMDGSGNYLCSNQSLSTAGTTMQFGYITKYINQTYYTPSTGWWELWVRNNGNTDVFLDLWLTDDITAFGGGTSFVGIQ